MVTDLTVMSVVPLCLSQDPLRKPKRPPPAPCWVAVYLPDPWATVAFQVIETFAGSVAFGSQFGKSMDAFSVGPSNGWKFVST